VDGNLYTVMTDMKIKKLKKINKTHVVVESL